MSHYRHTQVGTVILVFMLATLALLVAVVMSTGAHPAVLATGLILVVAGILFGSLTVEVDPSSVRLAFGPGLVRKSFPLSQIREVERVRNSWTYGWGIRLTPHGWLFNVSGLDAVEIRMAGGKQYRIGTDQPGELAAAIRTYLT